MTPEQEQQARRREDFELRRRLADAAVEKQRAANTAAIEEEAARVARENGWDTGVEPLVSGPSPVELLSLYGSIESLSRATSDPAKRLGVQVISQDDLDAERAREARFWAAGGGRLPGQQGPPPPRPSTERDSKFVRDSIEDGFTWA